MRILFEKLTGEPLFTRSCETATAILATIGQFIGDPPDEVLASLKGSIAYSHLFRQTKRMRPQESRFASRLPLEFRELGPLFEAIFQWNPDERISINAASKHPFSRDASRYCELPVLTLPDTGMTALARAHLDNHGASHGLAAVHPA
jgi:serine/threonine protein kinase